MTAISTIVGILPIAIGSGAGGEARAPLGVAVAGGMVFSTLLTIFVVPAAYLALERDQGAGPRRHADPTPAAVERERPLRPWRVELPAAQPQVERPPRQEHREADRALERPSPEHRRRAIAALATRYSAGTTG